LYCCTVGPVVLFFAKVVEHHVSDNHALLKAVQEFLLFRSVLFYRSGYNSVSKSGGFYENGHKEGRAFLVGINEITTTGDDL
jgi:hypothetical protein